MRRVFKIPHTALALLCVVLCGCALPSAEAPPGPWIAAAAVARDTESDIRKKDFPGIKDHVPALEQALSDMAKIFPPPPTEDGATILLTDGAAETSAVVAAAGMQNVRVVDNPYPRIAFYLASYYDNNGRALDALRVLKEGFNLTSGTQYLGQNLPSLYNEEGFALEILKNWSEGLQVCQAALKLPNMDNKARAKLYHCSGYCLNELGRLPEAESAYSSAIQLDADDKAAVIELQYVRERAAAQR